MDNIIKKIYNIIPFPFFNDKGLAFEGNLKSIPKQCISCNKMCFSFPESELKNIATCKNGFNIYQFEIEHGKIVIFGIQIKEKQGKIPRKQKKNKDELFIKTEELKKWEDRIKNLIKEIINFKDQKVKDNLSLFHDIIPTISLIFRTVEYLINKVPGDTFEDKVENADKKLKTLYHAIDLLDNRLKVMPLIGNPESAKFGQVTHCSPYKVFDKIVRIFNDTANKKGINLKLNKKKYITSEPSVYDSFMTLPFLLIENAIKYSLNNKSINIDLVQNNGSVDISVTSYGPIIKDQNVHKIFYKGFKDPNAQKFSSKGSGIGLYLAKIVADAHNIEIKYNNQDRKEIENKIEVGYNTFYFTLKE